MAAMLIQGAVSIRRSASPINAESRWPSASVR
jgi:hypothetical protein